ncbi:MAG: squalene/phytoene synthase family protein [Acidobacteriota bacterium]
MEAATHVRRVAHHRGANFSLGFRLLPPAKRRAVYAAYATCRIADDIVDEADAATPAQEIGRQLDAWAEEIRATYRGRPGHPATRALAGALESFPIPEAAFLGLVEGCRLDLEKKRYASFCELERYCELVAVTIADISLAIFGTLDAGAAGLGRHLALALQLTNICRDVGEDVRRGRIYLPLDELARFGVKEECLREARVDTEQFEALMAYQCARARQHFAAANPLPGKLAADARPAVRIMGGVYRRVLDRVAASPVAAFRRRVELPRWQRAWAVAAGTLGMPFVRGVPVD